MNYRRDLTISFLIAINLHALAGVCADRFMAIRNGNAVPLFSKGRSSILLTLAPSSQVISERKTDKSQENNQTLRIIEKQEKPVEEKPVSADADLLEKGVETFSEEEVRLYRPKYPLGSRLRGEEGLVRVKVVISEVGDVMSADVIETSGFPSLDNSAIEAARKASFVTKKSIESSIISFRFKLVD